MIIKYSDFIDFSYKPSSKDLICLFRITPAKGLTMKEAASRVASESSNGTWTGLDVPDRMAKLSARVFKIKGDYAWIAYPNDLFDDYNMPQVMSSIMGNIFGMKAVKGLRLEDVSWPKRLIKSFKGPKFGIKGVRRILGVKDRPVTATVVKPKVGYSSKEHARVGYEAWSGGLDLLKDDENLSSPKFNPFSNRLKLTVKQMIKAEKESGRRKGYLVNITAETNEMIKRAEMVAESGNKFVMVDLLTVGWAGLQTIREVTGKLGLAIHAHRAFHSAFDRNPLHGVSMKVIVEMARIIGTDTIHIGALGKLEGGKVYVRSNYLKAVEPVNKVGLEFLPQDWCGVKSIVPCCSGGLHVGIIKRLIDLLGKDMILQLGGGVHGHPGGTHAGALAFSQAVEAIMSNIPLRTYARSHLELKQALDKWGSMTPK